MPRTDSLRAQTAVVGIGLSDFGEVPGWSHLELMGQAVSRALADAGIAKSEVDGVFAVVDRVPLPVASVCEYLGIRPAMMDGTMIGGSSFVNHLQSAALAINAGICKVALITYGSNAKTGHIRPGGATPTPYESEYGSRLVTAYALATARHMHQYGTTRTQLAEVAVAARRWAQLNPQATMQGPLSIDDVLASRMVSDPLTVRDCCLISDGGGAVVMVSAERAAQMPVKPVYLLGVAAQSNHMQLAQMPDLTTTAAVQSGERAFRMAGLVPSDVDVLQLYDAFTINPILFLEDLGFCAKGEGGAFVSDGGIAPGGRLPVNTNGGGLSCMHPGMYGIFTIIETVTQLRGQAGARQVPNARIGLAHGNGGTLSTQVTALFGTEV